MEKKVEKVNPQIARQELLMVDGARDEAGVRQERVRARSTISSRYPRCLLCPDDRRIKKGHMCNRQPEKTVRGLFIPVPGKEKQAAGAQGFLVPCAASPAFDSKNSIFKDKGFNIGLLHGA